MNEIEVVGQRELYDGANRIAEFTNVNFFSGGATNVFNKVLDLRASGKVNVLGIAGRMNILIA